MYVQSCDLYAVVFQTLCALVRAVYRKRLGDHGFDVLNILIGFDAAEAQMQVIIAMIYKFVYSRTGIKQTALGPSPVSVQGVHLKQVPVEWYNNLLIIESGSILVSAYV